MSGRPLRALSIVALVALAGCDPPPPVTCPPAVLPPAPTDSALAKSAPSSSQPAAHPTVDEARAFFANLDTRLRKRWAAASRASWIQETFLNDDTAALAAAVDESAADFLADAAVEARRFRNVSLPPDLARQLDLLLRSSPVPAPFDAEERAVLTRLRVDLATAYGGARYCPDGAGDGHPKKCLAMAELEDILEQSRRYEDLLDAWRGWHGVGRALKPMFERFVALGNHGAVELGYADLGEFWRSRYDMPPADLAAEVDRLWSELRPFYEDLHCYVRGRLREKYGPVRVPENGPIPAHLLGNLWAQDWRSLYDLVEPFRGEGKLPVTRQLRNKRIDGKAMVKMGEGFFLSLGFDPLPPSFWARSLFQKPADREVLCHASAVDVTRADDLRLKMCIAPNEDDLVTVHHELGHVYYYHAYRELSFLLQDGANDGFHEAVGDTIALSVTPAYLQRIGLNDKPEQSDRALINRLMREALSKVPFLPFGRLVEAWRWDVFSGKIKPADYNRTFWDLSRRIQGVAPPVPRADEDFDAAAKLHVAAGVPYIGYFLAVVYPFQFQRALCRIAGHTGPLATCSIYGSKSAGAALRGMLELGASRPWPEVLAALSGERRADAKALLEYFAPLAKYLREQNQGKTCGY